MSSRRLQMVILQSPRLVENLKAIRVDSTMFADLNKQFLPMIRLHNPQVEIAQETATDSPPLSLTYTDGRVENFSNLRSFHEAAQMILDSTASSS